MTTEDALENSGREVDIVAIDIVEEVLEGGVVLEQNVDNEYKREDIIKTFLQLSQPQLPYMEVFHVHSCVLHLNIRKILNRGCWPLNRR